MKSVTRLHRSSAIQAYRDLLVRDFHPPVIRAVRAHVVSQTGCEVIEAGKGAPVPVYLSGGNAEYALDETLLSSSIAFG
jgi:hypothetical protein